MLLNGMGVEGATDVAIANGNTYCHTCTLKRAIEENISYNEAAAKEQGKLTGQKVKTFPSLRNRNAEDVCICHECLKKFSEETADDGSI